MPKMFIRSRRGTFDADARAKVAAALTELGLSCEELADTPTNRRNIWVFFEDHDANAAFSGGHITPVQIMTLEAFTLQGGLDGLNKPRFIERATAILGEHAAAESGEVPAFIVIHEIPEANWGMFGHTVSLAAMRTVG